MGIGTSAQEPTDTEDTGDTGVRALARGEEPDWEATTAEELLAYQVTENARRSAPETRAITGMPDAGAVVAWQQLALPGRSLPVRVHRPLPERHAPGARLPLVLHVHGGGFVGTAVQCDWVTSHLAAQLPAVVVSVEHRLLSPDTPLADAVDDGWDTLEHVVRYADAWGVDPERIAVFGESCGALITAMAAVRARSAGPNLRAQVLVNPAVDLTDSMLDYASVAQYADSPTLTVPQLLFFRRLAVPPGPGSDPRGLSPLYADHPGALPPTLVVVPTRDPLADQGRSYAERLQTAGTPTRITEYPDATHAFLSMPGVIAQAGAARTEITGFLRDALVGAES
jgi:acetyl esterase